jgi:hypothetical protein
VLAGDGADQEEAEAGAADARGVAARNAVEALEDAFELVGGKADASVGDGEGDVAVFDDGERAADFDGVGRVLDGVFEEIEDCGAEVLGEGASWMASGWRWWRRRVMAMQSETRGVSSMRVRSWGRRAPSSPALRTCSTVARRRSESASMIW